MTTIDAGLPRRYRTTNNVIVGIAWVKARAFWQHLARDRLRRSGSRTGVDMTIGPTGSGALAAAAACGLLTAAHIVSAPSAQACAQGQVEDPITRMCWSQSGTDENYGVSGNGPCLPGRLGNCLGALKTGTPAGSETNPAVPCGFGPQGGFPCGYW